MQDGREVANYILDYADNRNIKITNLSLQKIMYFCHVWYLVSTKEPLVKHSFEAWEFGPVLPYLFREFKGFEDQKITVRARKLDLATGERIIAQLNIDCDKEKILEDIVSFYSRFSVRELVEQSHVSGGPWDKAWNHKNKVNPGMKISNEEIIRFYGSGNGLYKVQ